MGRYDQGWAEIQKAQERRVLLPDEEYRDPTGAVIAYMLLALAFLAGALVGAGLVRWLLACSS